MNPDKKTIEAIKAEKNFLCGLDLVDFNLTVFLLSYDETTIQYYAFLHNTLLFQGIDIPQNPVKEQNTLPAAVDLLEWLTLRPGEVDSEFFKDYTEAQKTWANSGECESLQMWVGDFKYPESEAYQTAATRYFTQFFIS